MKTILVIENDGDTSDLISYIIEDMGFDVATSKRKLSPEDLFSINPVLILLDHFLDGSYGGDYCAELKANPLTKNIVIIMISATTQLERIAKDACADDFIEKPFDILDLEARIKRFV